MEWCLYSCLYMCLFSSATTTQIIQLHFLFWHLKPPVEFDEPEIWLSPRLNRNLVRKKGILSPCLPAVSAGSCLRFLLHATSLANSLEWNNRHGRGRSQVTAKVVRAWPTGAERASVPCVVLRTVYTRAVQTVGADNPITGQTETVLWRGLWKTIW